MGSKNKKAQHECWAFCSSSWARTKDPLINSQYQHHFRNPHRYRKISLKAYINKEISLVFDFTSIDLCLLLFPYLLDFLLDFLLDLNFLRNSDAL